MGESTSSGDAGNGTELWRLGAVEASRLIHNRQLKPSELMEAVVGRIEATNPHLNAITVDLTEQALDAARRADDVVAGRGDESTLPALFAIPVTIKENVDMAGQSTTNGVPALADLVAEADAPLVRNLTRAGAIIVGRTNTPEFSMRATTDNPLRGRTYNPWGDDISPGGSSGGAGAACAAGMGPIHHGNDIGGSLRFPSFANGTVTVKPTSFRVPVFNSTATAERGPLAQAMSVQGVIARHATDVRAATQAMIEPDPRDPHCPPVPWYGKEVDDPTVAVTTQTGGYAMHPGIAALLDRAADQLRDAGYRVVEADPPPILDAAKGWFSVGTTELKVMFEQPLREMGSPVISEIFDHYFALSELLDLPGYIADSGHRTALMRQWNLFLDTYPLVITPFMMRPMFDWDHDTRGLEAVRDLFTSCIYSTGINYLGLPAGVIGMDLVENRPAAIQIVGRRFREDLICDALEAIEDRNGVMSRRLWDREARPAADDPR